MSGSGSTALDEQIANGRAPVGHGERAAGGRRLGVIRVQAELRRERELPIWRGAATDLKAWLAVRDSVPAPELFVNVAGEGLTRSGFESDQDTSLSA
jgi:hypothetical protein